MKTEMINEMVTLNDEDMSKVNGGYQQTDINLLISSPTHIGKKSEKIMMNNNIKSMELKDDELELVSGGRRMDRALNSKVWMDDSLGRRGWMDDSLGRRGRLDS